MLNLAALDSARHCRIERDTITRLTKSNIIERDTITRLTKSDIIEGHCYIDLTSIEFNGAFEHFEFVAKMQVFHGSLSKFIFLCVKNLLGICVYT